MPSTSRTLVAPIGVHGLFGVSGGEPEPACAPGGVVTVVNIPVGLDQPFGTSSSSSSSSSSFGIGGIRSHHRGDSFCNDCDDGFWT